MQDFSEEQWRALSDAVNDTEDLASMGHCVHRLIEEAAERFSEKTALVCFDEEITYAELNARSNRIAHILMKRGVQRGDLVAVSIDRSINLVAVLLAVLKAGAAFVPIDPSFPTSRIKQNIDDATPSLVVMHDITAEVMSPWKDMSLNVDEALINETTNNVSESSAAESGNPQIEVTHEELAFVLYTSGSTGKPKGVELSHGALSDVLLSVKKGPCFLETDRMLAVTTITFDMAYMELFAPLLCGATVVIAQAQQVKDPSVIAELLERHAINTLQGTPSAWQMLLESGWKGQPRLRMMLSAGEPLNQRLNERLLKHGDALWNMYGPTETNYATYWKVCLGEDIVVGRAMDNDRMYVLDENLQPVPFGAEGELCIGGASVARGYRNNPELTAARFLKDPFGPGRMFRTGDLARFVAPGKLLVLGRIDGQMKIRGFRVEPGDIEAAMTDHWYVNAAAVAKHDDRLVAYCVRDPKVPVAKEAAGVVLESILRPWLAERMPPYMVPALFVEMDTIPMTLNGKIDRKALPHPSTVAPQPGSSPTAAAAAAQPASELEQTLVALWSDVLGHNRFTTKDNFFQVGGDSLRVVRLKQALDKQGLSVSPAKIFEHYTIKALAAYLAASSDSSASNIIAANQRAATNEDIAIISMACRLPGGAVTPEDFWKLLETGTDAITDVPKDRWNADALYNSDPSAPGKTYCRQAGFIPTIDEYDASFFGIAPREALSLDPAQYMLLETCWEGFERAGYNMDQLRGSQTGVYIGTSAIPAHAGLDPTAPRNLTELDGYTVTGSSGSTLSGRISYILGLEGPAMTVDTACSASLVTTHLACSALRQGECDVAVSAGAALMTNPGLHVEFSRLRGISADGRCRAFSADTEGTGWGEGAAVVLLKRLSDAQRDGDKIHAVLRSTAVNHDGRSVSLTAPSGPSQQKLIRTALAGAALQPADIDYVEAHGTATKLGDPIEGTALAEVFGKGRSESEPLLLGSAKSNIGHTMAAAGLVGLMKVVLSLQNNMLPKSMHISEPTPAVDWKSGNLALVQENRPWLPQENRLRRAGVSAFGIGGTNAHVIIEEAPKPVEEVESSELQIPVQTPTPFLLSGSNEKALRAQAGKLRVHLSNETHQDRLNDVAYSLATARTHFHKRLVVTSGDKAQLLDKLAAIESGSYNIPEVNSVGEPSLTVLFTGQGSQQPGMGKDLYDVYPAFREALDEIVANFSDLETPLFDIMWAEPGSDNAARLNQTSFAQPALFVLEVSLCRLWQSWGVRPEFLVGHSVGELAAAHVAGILNLSDACKLVAARGRLMQALPSSGKMVSLEASGAEVESAIKELGHDGKVEIAGYNTPAQTVISGDVEAVESLAAHIAGLGRRTKALETSHAFHSHHMEGMLADFQAIAETMQFNAPQIAIISSLTGKPAEVGQLEKASYWVQQARNAVRFTDAIQTVVERGANVFLEVGPRPVLCGMAAACLADNTEIGAVSWVPSLKPGMDGSSVIQSSLGSLHARHVSIDWAAYFKPLGGKRVDLPTYAFQREQFRPKREPNYIVDAAAEKSVNPYKWEIDWRKVDTESGRPRGLWGVMCPSGNSEWSEEVKDALSLTGMHLFPITQLEEAEQLDGLICLWDSSDDVLPQTSDFINKGLSLLQQVDGSNFSLPLIWVTRHAVGAGVGDGPVRLGAGPLWGFMRSIRTEHPELPLRMIDVDDATELTALAPALLLQAEPETALRRGQVFVPRMKRVESAPVEASEEKPLIRTDGAVLITGGLGDLGGRVARKLASVHGVRDIVLTSRRGMDSPGADALVAELAELGAKAIVVGGDIADRDNVEQIMSAFNEERPLRGVVHAAGLVDPGILTSLTPEKFANTFGPKVKGTWNLHKCTENMDLDIFMMFSSIAGIVGLPGLAPYSAANVFLDAVAHLRRSQGLPGTAVAYGAWGGDGMATTLQSTARNNLTQFGLGFFDPSEGLALFEQSIMEGRALTIGTVFDTDQLRNYYEERNGVPPLYHAMVGQTKKRVVETVDLRDVLSQSSPDQHPEIVLRMVRETVAKALGFSQVDDVDVSRPLRELGIDSLTAVLMRNRLGLLTGLALSANIALNHPNLKSISQYLLSQLQDTLTSSSSSASSSGGATPDTAASTASCLNMPAIRRGVLDPSFTFDNMTKTPGACTAAPETVFVTGATGFVGAFMVNYLLQKGISVFCLVRANSVSKAQERMVGMLQHYDLWDDKYESLLNSVIGDLALPLLGLTEEVFEDLAGRVDAVFHSGALVDWMRPLDNYIGPNLVSTHEVLRLASRGRAKAVHFVSTISTLPIHVGYGLTETDAEYGYGTSKYLAERLIAAARFRGAKASSYRLPFVAASATNGCFRLDRGDFLHNLISGCIELGAFPSINADLTITLPVDYLCNTMGSVMTEDMHRIGQDYDFLNTRAPTFDDFFKLLGAASGGKELLSFNDWAKRALDYAAEHPKSSLACIRSILDGHTDDTAGALVKGYPVGGANICGGENYPAPLIDEEYARKYVERINSSVEK